MKKLTAAFAALALLLAACSGAPENQATSAPEESPALNENILPENPAVEPLPEPEPEAYIILDPTQPPEDGQAYEAWSGPVEHLFFHPVIAYPELAFDGDYQEKGLDDWMLTVTEFERILESLYQRGYVLVDIGHVWSETEDENGNAKMARNTLYIPQGKKPLIVTYDDPNYYEYMLANGFTHKLILGEDGTIRSWGLDPEGNEVVSRDLDAITILDRFVEEHPDFSPFGAKACLGLTGYEGILGYRTQTDTENWSDEREAFRQSEIEAVEPIIRELKRTGWTFASHTWGHIRLDSGNMDKIRSDTQRWMDEVGSLIGETDILLYPHGARPDGNDWTKTGEAFTYLQEQGFRVFASVGIESFTYIKKDICAVICDRLHPDGTTLRSSKVEERYGQFYDVREIFDFENRPDYGVNWT